MHSVRQVAGSLDDPAASTPRRRAPGALLALALALAPCGSGAQPSTTTEGTRPAAVTSPHPREATRTKRQWGVDVIGVRLSAAGHMLEFRYRVMDPVKAAPLFVRKTKPVLVHEATGASLVVPTPAKTGALRNSDPPLSGRTYWMYFSNPGLVKPGDRVSVVIGEFRAEGVVVQ